MTTKTKTIFTKLVMVIVDEGRGQQRPKSLTQIDERRRLRPHPHPHHRRNAPNDVYAYANSYFINSCVSKVCQNSSRTGLDYPKIFLHSPAAILLHRLICPSSFSPFSPHNPSSLWYPHPYPLLPCQGVSFDEQNHCFLDRMIYCFLHENLYTQHTH